MDEVVNVLVLAGGAAIVAMVWLLVIKIALVIYEDHFQR